MLDTTAAVSFCTSRSNRGSRLAPTCVFTFSPINYTRGIILLFNAKSSSRNKREEIIRGDLYAE